MTACQIRVLTNGYLVSYMMNNELQEYCFGSRKETLQFLDDTLFQAQGEEFV